ncbi:MAG: hypothetical protein LBD82_04540, partial [Deltaproteobacteria bacterium]|nr:hypothetical protein [Deltaproteobacteria bacterium]
MSVLFSAPGPQLRTDLLAIPAALNRAMPLKNKHRLDLPLAVRDLSVLLTMERGQSRGYWARPQLAGAYMHYFMPWNILRLVRLLRGLPLLLQPGDHLLDLGSGPMTVPLALWLSRTESRLMELCLDCADQAGRPLELGQGVLQNLAEEAKTPLPWQIRRLRLPLEAALNGPPERYSLITAANVLNELPLTRRREGLEERLNAIFLGICRALRPGGQALLLEPGTRLGGGIITLMRSLALEYGCLIEAPCPHQAPCPLEQFQGESALAGHPPPGEKSAWRRNPREKKGWCHFSFPATDAWPELIKLSRAAGLHKEQLHLSCLLLRKPYGAWPRPTGAGRDGRAPEPGPDGGRLRHAPPPGSAEQKLLPAR